MVTIKDISNRLGISISSVSKALNGATDISKGTREKVIEVANEMGYVKKSLVNKTNLKFGIIIDQNCSDYNKVINYDIIEGFNSKALSDGNEIFIINIKDNLKKGMFDFIIKNNNLLGAILLTNNISETMMQSISKVSYPFIVVNNYLSIDKQNIGYVGVDMVEGMRNVVNYLHSCGYKKISFVGIKNNENYYQDKLVGYIASLTTVGVDYNQQDVLCSLNENFEKDFLNFVKDRKPDSVCCDNDLTAYKVLNILVKNGYSIPKDISIIGFDNNFISESSYPRISSVDYDKNELGVKAYVALNNILNGNSINRMQIKSEIVERESTKI